MGYLVQVLIYRSCLVKLHTLSPLLSFFAKQGTSVILCLSCVSVAMINTMIKGSMGMERFISFPLAHHCSSSKKVRAGTQGRNRNKRHGEVLLSGLPAVACAACFSVLSRTT